MRQTTKIDPFPGAIFALLAALIMLTVFNARAGDLVCEGQTHCVLMQMTPWHEDLDEPEPERWDRIKEIADGIDGATDDPLGRAFLAMTAYEESRLARFVQLDLPKCREGLKGWCDRGRSYSVWQLKRMTREETIAESAKVALSRFRRASNACAARGFDPIEGGISLYATGKTCKWSEAPARAEKLWRIHWRLGSGK